MLEHIIDAQGKKLGRIASQAAVFLMGKNSPHFKKNIVSDRKVKIINASKLDIDSRKLENVLHTHYTGYPGGIIRKNLALIARKKGYRELIRHAIQGMIPSNTLRKKIMKNLSVTE